MSVLIKKFELDQRIKNENQQMAEFDEYLIKFKRELDISAKLRSSSKIRQ